MNYFVGETAVFGIKTQHNVPVSIYPICRNYSAVAAAAAAAAAAARWVLLLISDSVYANEPSAMQMRRAAL